MNVKAKRIILWVMFSVRSILALIITGLCFYVLFHTIGQVPGNVQDSIEQTLERLRGLEFELKEKDAARRMQYAFPEGACFTVTLYGLAWANILHELPSDDLLHVKGRPEVEWALAQQNTQVVIGPFSDTQVRNGVFWLGQRNLLLAQYLKLLPGEVRSSKLVEEFHENSKSLNDAFLESPTYHLDSYPSLCWPADNVTALVSLVLHDELYGTEYRKAYESWKEWTQNHSDPRTGMPAGHLRRKDGLLIESARGCANSWIIPMLTQIDSDHASELYSLYRKNFAIRRLGYEMFREWPRGSNGHGADCDSGPIIWDAGMSATGAGLAAARSQGDTAMEADILDLSRLFGMSNRWNTVEGVAKESLWGLLPVGDAFLAWGESIHRPEENKQAIPSYLQRIGKRWPMYIVLFIIMSVMVAYEIWGIRLLREGLRKLPPATV